MNPWEKIAQEWAAQLKAQRLEPESGLVKNLAAMRDAIPRQTERLASDRSAFNRDFQAYQSLPENQRDRKETLNLGRVKPEDYDREDLLDYIWRQRIEQGKKVPYPLYDADEMDRLVEGDLFINPERAKYLQEQQAKSYDFDNYTVPKDFFDQFMDEIEGGK